MANYEVYDRATSPFQGASAAVAALSVDRQLRQSLQHQIVRQIRQFILSGRLRQGARMPSTRGWRMSSAFRGSR